MPIFIPRDLFDQFQSDAIGQQADLVKQAIAATPPPEPPQPPTPPPADQAAAPTPPSDTLTNPTLQSPPALQDLLTTAGLAPQSSGSVAPASTTGATSVSTAPAAPTAPPPLSDLMQTAGLGDQATLAAPPPSTSSSGPPALSDLLKTAGLAGQQVTNAVTQKVDQVQQAVQNVGAQISARTSQFGMGLDNNDAYAFCGPAAAIAFAQTYGRNPTVAEAKQLAQQVGWSPNQGMAGIASEQSLLKEMGVGTKLEQGANWDHIAQDASSGNPVILDTPGHYYYVSGTRTNAQGKTEFDVGTSGTDLRGGAEWMTADQINAMPQSKGAVRGALFADNPNTPGQSIASAGPSTPTSGAGDAARALGAPDNIASMIDQAASTAGIAPSLLAAVTKQESGFRQSLADGSILKSGAGALGLTQLMPETAKALGVDPNDPAQNLLGGARYLKQLLDQFGGDVTRAIAAYNAGPGAVQQYGGTPPYQETQDYVRRVTDNLQQAGTSITGAGQSLVGGAAQAPGAAASGVAAGATTAAQDLAATGGQLAQQGATLTSGLNRSAQSLADYTTQKLAPINAEADRLMASNQQAADQTTADQTAQATQLAAPPQPPQGPLDAVKQKFSDAIDALGGLLGGASSAIGQGAGALGQAAQTAPLEGGGYGAPGPLTPAEQAQNAAIPQQIGQGMQAINQSPYAPSALLGAGERAAGGVIGGAANYVLSGQAKSDVADQLEQQADQAPLGPLIPQPVQSFGLKLTAGLLRAPGVVDQMQAAQDISQKYGTAPFDQWTPEDQRTYGNAMLAVGGLVSPLAAEGDVGAILTGAARGAGIGGQLTRTGADVRTGLYSAGEMGTMLPREQLPNYNLFESTPGARFSDAEGEFGYHPPPPTQTPLVPGTEDLPAQQKVRQVVADLQPNERIPRDLQDPKANAFADAMRANGASIGQGQWTPEQTTLSALLTRFSQGRGQTPAAKMYSGLGEEFMLRQRPSLQTQGATTGGAASYGLVIRPETMAAHIAGDTTNPDMMEMLTALSRPALDELPAGTAASQASFATRQERAAAIQNGVDEFYRLAQSAGQGGDRGDRTLITGGPIVRKGVEMAPTGRQAWADAIPAVHQDITDWGTMSGKYQGMDESQAKAQLLSDLQNAGVAGIGLDKAPFVANMGFSPEYGILDLRMRRNVFGLSPKAQLTRAERDVLEQKLADNWPNANSNYVAQWLPWAYMTDEKTDYTSIASAYNDVGGFMRQAQQTADAEGRPMGEVVRDLAAQQPKLPVDYPTSVDDVTTRIGAAPQVVQSLPPGTSGEALRKAAPELEAFRRQAGVEFVEKPSVGTGLGIGPDGQPVTQPDADLAVRGPLTANRYFGAAWLAANPKEDSMMLAHTGPAFANAGDSLATLELKGVSQDELAGLHDALTSFSPDGWHTKVTLDRRGNQNVASVVIGGVGKDVDQFAGEIQSLVHDLHDESYTVTSANVEPAQIEFMGQSDVPEVLYGGPRGAATRTAETAAAGTAGRPAPAVGQPLGGPAGAGEPAAGAGPGANAPPVRDVGLPPVAGPAAPGPGAAAAEPAATGAGGAEPAAANQAPGVTPLFQSRAAGATGLQYATSLGGAAAGGLAGYNSDQNAPMPERIGRAAVGAALGATGAYAATRGAEGLLGEAPAAEAGAAEAGATGLGRQRAQINLGPPGPQRGQTALPGFGTQNIPPPQGVQRVAQQIGATTTPSRAFDLNALSQMRAQYAGQQPPLLQTAQKAATPLDRFIGYTVANMLWGIGTAVHITTSQALQSLGRPMVTAASGHPMEAARDAAAMTQTIGDAFSAFGRTIQTGQRAGLGFSAPLPPTAVEQAIGFPLRVHSAINEFYRTLNTAGGAAAEASRLLRENPSLSFQDVLQRFPSQIIDAGATAGARATFMEGGGSARVIGQKIGQVSQDMMHSPDPTTVAAGTVLRWLVPMTHIPAVILGEGIRGLPVVNEIRGIQRATQLARAGEHYQAQQELGRTALTSFANLAILGEVANGNITGDGPTTPADKQRLMEGVDSNGNATWRPNSIRMPDGRWLDYTGLGPIALSMSSIANLVEAAKTYAEKPPDQRAQGAGMVPELAQDLLGREAGTIGQTWFLRGLADTLTAIKEGTVGGTGAQISQAGDRLTPFGALLNEVRGFTDPLARNPQGPIERIESRTPFLSQNVEPRLAATTGQPEQQPHDIPSLLFRSTPPGMMTPNPVGAEISRLNEGGNRVSVPYNVKSYKGAQQTPEAQQAIRAQVGQAVNLYASNILQDPKYAALNDAQKANALSQAVGQAQSAADITLDQQVARSPHESALLQWSQTPQYAGISSKLPPEQIAQQNWVIAQAKTKLSQYRTQYGAQAENRLRRDDPQAFNLSQRDRLDTDVLTARKRAIDRATGGALSQAQDTAASGGLVGAGSTTLPPP